ncbi:hypothetical protein DES49_0925 [Halospina denitrificans]|uniref:Uncharacterized protein n=1 Tax=Halospina denitrificans TaxID=332522 RepID=A0A4R7JY74_9GAMM|nr:hypothetical protein [Halospina denitrificans]TDT43115.1 hypothetical protein DES49_0925 [Halospina denitrificans]
MRFRSIIMGLATALLMAVAGSATAEDTDITIRVLSKDAKFIGTSMGGMRVTLRDAHTGELLSEGVTAGGTGDTSKIMHKDGGRRILMADDSAASFETTLDLEEPRLVEAEVYGPLGQPQAAHRASATQWVIPGGDLSVGDGWVIELPGFVVNILEPAAAQGWSSAEMDSVKVTANVMMMCGCPITPDGLWDANRYEVGMTVTRDGETVAEQSMNYAGKASHFEGEVPVDEAGVYEVTVHAYDPHNGNTGVDRTTLKVQ